MLLTSFTGEERQPLEDLGQDAADGPHVDARSVDPGAEEQLWSSIPAGHNDVGVDAVGRSEELGQPEVADLEDALSVDQQIVGLDVSVENPVLVKIFQPLNGL